MGPRLHWRVGPGDVEAVAAPGPERIVPARPQRRVALTAPMVALYLAALACAGGVGFGLGRWSQARSAIAAEVNRQLALETVAYREADPGLLEPTLDPQANESWRAAQLRALALAGPVPGYVVTLESVTPLGPALARVTVRSGPGPDAPRETRLYRASGSTWFRAPTGQGPNQP